MLAASTVPMLEDLAITPVRLRCSSSCSNQSWMTRSCTGRFLGTVIRVSGVTLPASSSDAAVSTFSTEPGS